MAEICDLWIEGMPWTAFWRLWRCSMMTRRESSDQSIPQVPFFDEPKHPPEQQLEDLCARADPDGDLSEQQENVEEIGQSSQAGCESGTPAAGQGAEGCRDTFDTAFEEALDEVRSQQPSLPTAVITGAPRTGTFERACYSVWAHGDGTGTVALDWYEMSDGRDFFDSEHFMRTDIETARAVVKLLNEKLPGRVVSAPIEIE